MNATRVGRLTLTAPDEALVRRGAILLEDAMNVATLQTANDHRAYIVRHLDVGVIADDIAPQVLALQIEQRLATVQRFAVPATSQAAAAAASVWFVDEVTAIAELARRIAAGPRPSEWFWPHVAHGAVRLPAPQALRRCLGEAARAPAAALAVAIVVDAIETAREGALLAALGPGDARELFGSTFGVAPPEHLPARGSRHTPPQVDMRWFARLVRWTARWGGDARAQWLAAVALVHTRRTVRSPAAELASAGELVASISSFVAPSAREVAHEPSPGRRAARPAFEPAAADADAVARETAAPPPPLAAEDAFASAVTGVLLLVRPLAALGIATWLDDHEWAGRSGFAGWLLAAIASAAIAGAPDPLVDALGTEPDADRFVAAAAAIGWTHAVASWLRDHSELVLDEVVARPGRVVATPTHLEVTWPLREADVRVRMIGLDVDPGWVPWLGRVVRFHYSGDPR